MIKRSIAADCTALGEKIANALCILSAFVREVREARSDVDGVSRELHSLGSVLDLLTEDACLFPPELAEHIPAVLAHCSNAVDDIEVAVSTLNDSDLSKQQKRTRWLATGRQESAKFRTSLEARKAVLGLALDLVGATAIRDVTSDIEPNKRNTMERRQNSTDVIEDVSRILVEMSQLRMRLPGELDKSDSNRVLHDYMNDLKMYAELIVSSKESEHEAGYKIEKDIGIEDEGASLSRQTSDPGAFMGERELFGAYVGDTPDSAIDVNHDLAFKTLRDALGKASDEEVPNIDDLMNEMILENIPSRAPTPPPKDIKRLEAARNTMVSPFDEPPADTVSPFGVTTEITSTGRKTSMESSTPSVASKTRKFGRIFRPIKAVKNSISEHRPQTRATNSTGDSASSDIRPSTPVIQASLVRRGSHRLSVSFKKLPMWQNNEILATPEGPDVGPVFGVSLQRSMQIAKGTSKTHHGGKGGSSRRDFPLCMQKCLFFLKNEGIEAPDIFAEPGDSYRVAMLKEIFSTGPTFGDDISWANFGVYDAADLVLLFLSQLPRPLISETIAKRWISLSRQATVSGSHGTRIDQCIDFWEEALGGLRGPARSLFKLLLNLWAEIAESADKNDMTAERLAGVVLKPLMHISSEKYATDFMLSLAFLIRRRSEYTELLKKDSEVKRISRAQW
ncbi:hypothetical protein F5Y15DRAFT_409671 [Xylariaceae sp. FL0016]|nr:hypothetical protein F5Y15DRAFT_409671 [Xylariaceae sp. FL0016]